MDDDEDTSLLLFKQAEMLHMRFSNILGEIVKVFPEAKLHPNNISGYDKARSNKEFYDENMRKMMKLQNDFFLFKNEVMRASDKIKTRVLEIDVLVNAIDIENAEINARLEELKNSSYSAEGLFDDAQISRNEMWYGNLFLFIVILGGVISAYKTTKTG